MPDQVSRENDVLLKLAIDAVDMAWWNLNLATGEVSFHRRKADMLGFPPEQFNHYEDFTALMHPDDYEQAMQAMRDHMYGKAKVYETEYRIRTSKGDYKWFYDIGSIVERTTENAPLRIIGFVIDRTRQKAVELEIKKKNEELHDLIAEKDKFFSIIAHDLKGPLGTFREIATLIEEEENTLDENLRKSLLSQLSASASNSYDLLENLLKWSQMKRGTADFNPVRLPLQRITIESIRVLQEQANLKAISLKIDIPGELEVYADTFMLQTIIRNLVANAIKFTPKGGSVTVSARPADDDKTEILVADTGIGMKPELVENLFRVDYNSKRPGTANEKGTGLGLLLCKELVEKHGGTLQVTSEESRGSVFGFTI